MDSAQQTRQAEQFRNMHRGPSLLLLPNAWDALSARIFAAAGFPAIATTSGGVSWAIGFADGEAAPWEEVVAATRRIVRAVEVPVTADIEAGFGETPDQVAKSVSDIIAAGAVGINLEDGNPHGATPIRPIAEFRGAHPRRTRSRPHRRRADRDQRAHRPLSAQYWRARGAI